MTKILKSIKKRINEFNKSKAELEEIKEIFIPKKRLNPLGVFAFTLIILVSILLAVFIIFNWITDMTIVKTEYIDNTKYIDRTVTQHPIINQYPTTIINETKYITNEIIKERVVLGNSYNCTKIEGVGGTKIICEV